jgi:hypothetical protein
VQSPTDIFPDARQNSIWQRLKARWLTTDGNIVNRTPVTGAVAWNYLFVSPEPDGNYGVVVTPSWNTAVWVTAKSATGFTVNFSVAVPVGGSIDVATFRGQY